MGTAQRSTVGPARRALATIAMLALMPSCTGSGSPQMAGPTPDVVSTGTGQAPAVVVVGPDAAGLPAACRPARTGAVVASLLAAINAGDAGAIDRLISPEPEFQWYSVAGRPGERFDPSAESRSGLPGYLLERHARGERLHLGAVRVNGSDWRAGTLVGHFEYTLTRSADDMPGGKPVFYLGKGALNCSAGRVLVWSMGPDRTRATARLAPNPGARRRRTA